VTHIEIVVFKVPLFSLHTTGYFSDDLPSQLLDWCNQSKVYAAKLYNTLKNK